MRRKEPALTSDFATCDIHRDSRSYEEATADEAISLVIAPKPINLATPLSRIRTG